MMQYIIDAIGLASITSPLVWIVLFFLMRKKHRTLFFTAFAFYLAVILLTLERNKSWIGPTYFPGDKGLFILGIYTLSVLFLCLALPILKKIFPGFSLRKYFEPRERRD